MASYYGDQFTKTRDGSREFIDVAKWGGRVRVLTDHRALTAAGIAAGDLVYLARLPSNAVILPQSAFYFDALTGANAVDFGGGNDPDGLATDIDMTTAGTALVLEAVDRANYGKKLWELLSYTEDPKTQIDLYATMNGELTADGDLTVVILYVLD
jgi:hypothetical protein